jgi:hypothetical protein
MKLALLCLLVGLSQAWVLNGSTLELFLKRTSQTARTLANQADKAELEKQAVAVPGEPDEHGHGFSLWRDIDPTTYRLFLVFFVGITFCYCFSAAVFSLKHPMIRAVVQSNAQRMNNAVQEERNMP